MLRSESAAYAFHAEVVWAGQGEAPPIPHGVRLVPRSPADQVAWERLLLQPPQEGSPRAGRFVVDLPARCLVEGGAYPLPGNVLDLSAGGLRLHLPEVLPVGTVITVIVTGALAELRLPGRIERAQAHPGERPAHGVAFTDPGASQHALREVVPVEFPLRMKRLDAAACS